MREKMKRKVHESMLTLNSSHTDFDPKQTHLWMVLFLFACSLFGFALPLWLSVPIWVVCVPLMLFIAWYAVWFEEFRKFYPPGIERHIPVEMTMKATWVNIYKALTVGMKIQDRINMYREKTGYQTHVFSKLRGTLFLKSRYLGFDSDKLMEKNREDEVLWLARLSESPLMDRIAVLLSLDTDEKIKAFMNRPIEDIKKFIEPFEGFEMYVTFVHDYEWFRCNQLNKMEVWPNTQQTQEEVDALFEYGMKGIMGTIKSKLENDN